ncbi:MAG: hypothetical protein GY857_03255 [Desulfobacula sp.]|nr:hypothetical protein [Desulfobacula sp.]
MMEKKIGTITIYYTDLLVKKDIAQKQATTKQSISGFNAIAGKSIKGSIQTQIFDNITSKHLGG